MTDARRYAVRPEPRSRSLKGSRPSVPHGTNFYYYYNVFVVSVDVRLGYRKRPYVVTMELHMMAVLMPFNSADMMTFSDLRDVTQLPDKDLQKQLQLIVDSKILLSQVSALCVCFVTTRCFGF